MEIQELKKALLIAVCAGLTTGVVVASLVLIIK